MGVTEALFCSFAPIFNIKKKNMNEPLTFNDLPMVVAQLRDEVVGMKQMIVNLQSQNKPHKANTHIPMSVEEASAYLKMPMATLYMKLGNGSSTLCCLTD